MTAFPITAEDFPVVVLKLDENGGIEYAGPQIERLMGIAPESVVGKNFFKFFRVVESSESLKQAASKRPLLFEHPLQTHEGEKYFCWHVYASEGSSKIAFGFEMTQSKLKSDYLIAAMAEADAASQAKTDFIAHTSHELRTPLNAVIGYSEMLLDEIYECEPEHLKHDLEKINSAAKHLLSLINSVLDLSKIEAGKIELYNEQFGIEELVVEIASTCETLIKKNKNRVELKIAKGLGAMYADRTKLREILFNLISNASKFTQQGQICLSCYIADQRVIFEVSDTGCGMSTEEQEALFKPYTQFRQKDRLGTGLGLMLSRQLTKLMGGEISVRSEENKGTVITVKLPLVYHAQRKRSENYSDLVLVIDDDPAAHEIIGHMLKKQGLKMISAMNGIQGLRLAKESRPLAIILDLIMPEMDGWEVLRQLKFDPDLKDTPVVISTVDDSTPKTRLAMKVDDYLLKPINAKLLETILNRYRPEGEKKFSLMVVDDDADARQIIMRLAEKEGCEVWEARNGNEALSKLYACRPDLILLDLVMPGMNGFEFVHHFQREEKWRGIPLIVLTSKELSKDDREYLGMYAESLLEKEAGGYEALQEIISEINHGE
ncbi:MAG: response regulator [Chlamydiales bacterium]|nr:response regulator [Chlamydiales bacterium]